VSLCCSAWHISGGEGAAQNTTCLRVIVFHKDGHQSVQEVKVGFLFDWGNETKNCNLMLLPLSPLLFKNDFGLDRSDVAEITKRLNAQGIKDIEKISLDGTG
jgi:hypothetical protein